MTETPLPADPSLAQAISRLGARLDAIETRLAALEQGPERSVHITPVPDEAKASPADRPGLEQRVVLLQDRARAAWTALTAPVPQDGVASRIAGGGTAAAPGRSPLGTAALVVLALVAVLLAVEAAEHILHGLRHMVRRIF